MAHAEIGEAHDKRAVLRVAVNAKLGDFREVRFYRRGRHKELLDAAEWFGWRRRKIEIDVFDDVVLVAAMRPKAEIASKRELRRLERRKIPPGSVLLKCFRNIAGGDLKALFPNARVVMSNTDKLVLSVPALASGIPILINLYTTITVLFLVLGSYLGLSASIEDKDMKTALAALSALVALGGFIVTQWVRYQRQSLKYQIELTDNIYYRNINNNAGIFDYVIGAAEEQQVKEAFLAYHFLHEAASPPIAAELDRRIEDWLRATFGIDVDFDVGDALDKLERLGLLKRDGERLIVVPLTRLSTHCGACGMACFRRRPAAYLFAEIRGFDLFILAQRLGGIGADDMAVVQQVAAIGDRQTLLGVLLDQKDAHAGFLDARERSEQPQGQQRREAERRFVEQQDSRRRHHGAADCHHLALAAAHGAHELLAALLELREQAQHTFQILRLVRAGAPRMCAEHEILLDGQVGKNAAVLWHERDAGLHDLVRRAPRDVGAVHRHRAAFRLAGLPGDGADERALTRAIGAEHDDDLALRHRRRHVFQRAMAAVKHRDIAGLKHSRLRDRPGSRRGPPALRRACLPRSWRRYS